jgi:hypothetical protein
MLTDRTSKSTARRRTLPDLDVGLSCFLKHKATTSYEKYMNEKGPTFSMFRESDNILPPISKPRRKARKAVNLNNTNLTLLGQREWNGMLSDSFEKRNLQNVDRRMDRLVRRWVKSEKMKVDSNLILQKIDHDTFCSFGKSSKRR